MKAVATVCTYDPNDCTSTGVDAYLYPDGHVSVVYRSRWQGSHDGRRWATSPGYVDLSTISDYNPDWDLEAALTNVAYDHDIEDGNWRLVRAGTLVR